MVSLWNYPNKIELKKYFVFTSTAFLAGQSINKIGGKKYEEILKSIYHHDTCIKFI